MNREKFKEIFWDLYRDNFNWELKDLLNSNGITMDGDVDEGDLIIN